MRSRALELETPANSLQLALRRGLGTRTAPPWRVLTRIQLGPLSERGREDSFPGSRTRTEPRVGPTCSMRSAPAVDSSSVLERPIARARWPSLPDARSAHEIETGSLATGACVRAQELQGLARDHVHSARATRIPDAAAGNHEVLDAVAVDITGRAARDPDV